MTGPEVGPRLAAVSEALAMLTLHGLSPTSTITIGREHAALHLSVADTTEADVARWAIAFGAPVAFQLVPWTEIYTSTETPAGLVIVNRSLTLARYHAIGALLGLPMSADDGFDVGPGELLAVLDAEDLGGGGSDV